MGTERKGRSEPRIYELASMTDAKMGALSMGNLYLVKEGIRGLVSGLHERRYDPEAVACYDGDEVEAGMEPLLVHEWKGRSEECLADGKTFDARGLRIILRGRGEIQTRIRGLLTKVFGLESDRLESENGSETFTYGCKLPIRIVVDVEKEGWGKPVPPIDGYLM